MAESMSNLERVLRTENGINIMLRKKLIKAYTSDHGMVELPALIEENAHLINADLLPRLRKLAKDEDYAGN